MIPKAGLTRTNRSARSQRDRGFTLIELLVVITILGILAGVVVFAVRGSGDKGQQAAIDTDKRMIRTAEEAYCAKHGRYADMGDAGMPGTLVGDKFLSARSEYHDVRATTDLPDPRPCNGWRYELTGGGDPAPVDCYRVVDGAEEKVTVTPSMAAEGYSCLAAPPTGTPPTHGYVHPLVKLPDGRVMVMMEWVENQPPRTVRGLTTTSGHRTALFDPSAGPRGKWMAGPLAYTLKMTNNVGDAAFDGMVVLQDSPTTPNSDCEPHCGKVLAHFKGENSGTDHWALYDPQAGALGQWTEVTSPGIFHVGGAKFVQLMGEGCDPQCGKVLIVPRYACATKPPVINSHKAEIYDPKTNQFSLAGGYEYTWQTAGDSRCASYPQIVELPDGRALLVTSVGSGPGRHATALLLNPRAVASALFAEEAFHNPDALNGYPLGYYKEESQPTRLADGAVLFTQRRTEIYRPEAGGKGSWEDPRPPHCGEVSSFVHCHVLASLLDGKVLVSVNGTQYARAGRVMRVFDPDNRTWSDTGSLNYESSGGFAIRLGPPGCGSHCGKVLIVGIGGESAEIYTAPA